MRRYRMRMYPFGKHGWWSFCIESTIFGFRWGLEFTPDKWHESRELAEMDGEEALAGYLQHGERAR